MSPNDKSGSRREERGGPGGQPYLLAGVEFTSPLMELRTISEKKIRTFEELGEDERAEREQRAYEMARVLLARQLGEEG